MLKLHHMYAQNKIKNVLVHQIEQAIIETSKMELTWTSSNKRNNIFPLY